MAHITVVSTKQSVTPFTSAYSNKLIIHFCMVVARTGQHTWHHPEWNILPTRIGCYLNTNCDRRSRSEDNNVDFTHVQPHYWRVQRVEPCH